MIELAKNQNGDLKSIKENLEQRVKCLSSNGRTALGPALAFSIGFSSQKSGSEIILCTDGCANIGIGSFEDDDQGKAIEFYEDLADYAKESGVTVNVISVEEVGCNLALLCKVAERSNGTLSIVNPLKLKDQFDSIIDNRILATSVQAKLIVNHKYLYLRTNELELDEARLSEEKLNEARKSVLVKDIGNARSDTEIMFEYAVREVKNEVFKELPFKLQISYRMIDGTKAIRVYNKVQEFTTERRVALFYDLIFCNALQNMSRHAMSNNIDAAKSIIDSVSEMKIRTGVQSPVVYDVKQRAVEELDINCESTQVSDKFAAEMYSGMRMNRRDLNSSK